MNIESTTIPKAIQAAETQQQAPASTSQDTLSQDSPSFKAALASVKGQDTTLETGAIELISGNLNLSENIDKTHTSPKNALPESNNILKGQINLQNLAPDGQNETTNVEIISQINQSSIDKTKKTSVQSDKKTFGKVDKESKDLFGLNNLELNPAMQSLMELNSKLAAITDLKSSSISKTERKENKVTDTVINYQTIKMSNNDALFFANLVKNENFSAQQVKNGNDISTELKSEATMQSAQVSQVLMDAIGDSIKTNKPFRIDFDKDISVILKIDKNGKLSAEFIPGDKAVENYLRNNIPLLEQRLDEQNLPYGSLSYQRQKQQNQQQENNNKQHKEKDDE